MSRIRQGAVFDYPQYFDLSFRSETKREVEFFEAACREYVSFPVTRLLEPGCGGGRLIVALADRGFEMAGFDLSGGAIRYLERRLRRRRLEANVWVADMADFHLGYRVDAAFCTFDTFRYLATERRALRHLELVASHLRPGGIYILGFHLLPRDVADEAMERWWARHGATRVCVTLRASGMDRRRRVERVRLTLKVQSPRRRFKVQSETEMRLYTAAQFRRLLRKVPALELCNVYDFWYDIHHPLALDDKITDSVFILRKR